MQSSLPDVPSSSSDVEAAYANRLAILELDLARSHRRQTLAVALSLAVVALCAVLLLRTGTLRFTPLAAIPLCAGAVSLHQYLRARAASHRLALRCACCERGLDRLRGNLPALEPTGEEFARTRHLYQDDLNILGPRSLFSLLCTTRSQAGAERLASFLLDPVDPGEAQSRQDAVRELLPAAAFREEIALLGKYSFQECDPNTLREWLDAPVQPVPRIVPVTLLLSGCAILFISLACLAQTIAWPHALPFLIPLVLLQGALAAPFYRSVRRRLRTLRALANEFTVLRQGLTLLEGQTFAAPRLAGLVSRLRALQASASIRTLEHLLRANAQREKELFALPSLFLAAGTQLVFAVERWRAAHGASLHQGLAAWAEFEALSAIACYAYEHPDDAFPHFVTDTVLFEAESLGHPLLPPATCVRNSLRLDAIARFAVVSGSNMAGKSTWLRAIGVNAVLAYAGAPVRAQSMRLSSLAVGASSSVTDSLVDGKSRFLAEAERLRAILAQGTAERPTLFLIDEFLSGTNSRDRRIAADAFVRALLAAGAIGLLSTHDLAITAIAADPRFGGTNCCMESADPADPLRFDYIVKPGVSRISSALAILHRLGIGTGPPEA